MKRIELSGPQARRIREAVGQLTSNIDNVLRPGVSGALGMHAGLPQQLTDFSAQLSKLQEALQLGSAIDSAVSIPMGLAPVLATAAAYYRRRFVTDLERQRARAVAGELLRNIDSAKAPLDELLTAEWYLATKPLRLPRLRQYVAESRFETERQTLAPPPRHFDDKFGILWSASHLLPDLEQVRNDCGERFTPVAIGFVDVDGLKALNSELGETWVDALILPPLMRSIERAVYGHGYAYRYGGDEFVLVTPSTNDQLALAILRRLREDLASTAVEILPKPPTVSIGLCVLDPDSPLTDREALHWAALAKREAKTRRNAIAVVEANREISNPKIKVLEP